MKGLELIKENFGEFSTNYVGEIGFDKEKLSKIKDNIVSDMSMLFAYIVDKSTEKDLTTKAMDEFIEMARDLTIVTIINMCLEDDDSDNGTTKD